MARTDPARRVAQRLGVSQAEVKKALKESIQAKVIDPGKTAKGDENEVCPKCGQDKQHGYLSIQVSILGVRVRILYSSACGFTKVKPFG